MQSHKEVIWTVWLNSVNRELKDLGLVWSGYGGENVLKEAFEQSDQETGPIKNGG